MDSQGNPGSVRFPSAIEITGIVACALPFVISTATTSSQSVNGVVTSFEYRDWFAVAGGGVGIACGLLSAISIGKTAKAKRALRGLLMLLLVAGGGYQVLRGLGKVGIDRPDVSAQAEPAPMDPMRDLMDTSVTANASAAVLPLARRFVDQWRAGKVAEIYEEAHAKLKRIYGLGNFQHLYDVMSEAFGTFEKTGELTTETQKDSIIVKGPAIFTNGTLELVLTFDPDRGVPRMIAFNLQIPPSLQVAPTDADGDAFGRRVLDSVLQAKFDKSLYHPDMIQMVGDHVEARLATMIGEFGTIKSIGEPEARECSETRCITFPIVGSKGKGTFKVDLLYAVRSWRVMLWELKPD
jgi:hypothetical protein